MKLRLLLRRLTVSAPRMAVRSALPWPVRWIVLAVVAGFCAAIAMWSFDLGKEIAGLDRGTKEQLTQVLTERELLRAQIQTLTTERDKAQSVANTVDTVLTTERVAREKIEQANQALQVENQQLKDDLGFFEQLLPESGGGALTLRGVRVMVTPQGELQWQVLVIQGAKNPRDFEGQLELTFSGSMAGKPWSAGLPTGAMAVKVKQYGRFQGVYALPADAVVKTVTVKLLQGSSVRVVRAVKVQG